MLLYFTFISKDIPFNHSPVSKNFWRMPYHAWMRTPTTQFPLPSR